MSGVAGPLVVQKKPKSLSTRTGELHWAQRVPEAYPGEKAYCQHGDVQGGSMHASPAQHPFVSNPDVQAASWGSAGAWRRADIEGLLQKLCCAVRAAAG